MYAPPIHRLTLEPVKIAYYTSAATATTTTDMCYTYTNPIIRMQIQHRHWLTLEPLTIDTTTPAQVNFRHSSSMYHLRIYTQHMTVLTLSEYTNICTTHTLVNFRTGKHSLLYISSNSNHSNRHMLYIYQPDHTNTYHP